MSPSFNRTASASVLCFLGTTLALLSSGAILAAHPTQSPGDSTETLLTVKRGLSAELQFKHSDGNLRALPDQSIDSEVLVRLERTTTGGNSSSEFDYTLSFFGTVAGTYDLANWIVHSDSTPIAHDDKPLSLGVRFVSELPIEQGTSLYELSDPPLHAPRGYRAALTAFVLAWLAVPGVWVIVRLRSKREEPAPIAPPAPSLADRLRPLIQLASVNQLSVAEQGRLEMLLYVFWQRKLGLPETMADALPIMRSHEEAGDLLRTLEAWVHAEASARPELTDELLNALLTPYHAYEAATQHAAEVESQGVYA